MCSASGLPSCRPRFKCATRFRGTCRNFPNCSRRCWPTVWLMAGGILLKMTPNFPEQCRFVLEAPGEVYGYDEQARVQGLSAEGRLQFHQEHGKPVMEKL